MVAVIGIIFADDQDYQYYITQFHSVKGILL